MKTKPDLWYDESGLMKFEGKRDKGNENGKRTEYFKSNRIKSEYYYKNGNPTGIWFWYDEDRNIIRKKSYIQR